jgi:hypothetical protein
MMASNFLDVWRKHGAQGPLPRTGCGGPAAQGKRPRNGEGSKRDWDFGFATGIECSNPVVVDAKGNRIRRDLREEWPEMKNRRKNTAV